VCGRRIPGGVHARDVRPPVGVGDDRPGLGQLAAERRGEPVRLVPPRVHEQRVAPLGRAVRELDLLEAAIGSGKPGDRFRPDAHARGRQQPVAGVRRAVRAEHDIVAPSGEHERRAHGARAAGVERQRPVAHFPAVAERAVEHRLAPQCLDPGQRRRVVAQAVGQHDRVGAHGRPVRRRQDEPIPDPLDVADGAMTELDVRVLLELTLPAFAQVRRLHPIMPEQPADTFGHGVCRPVVVHHEHPLPRPAQHESRAQARGPAAHNHGVVPRVAPGIEVMEPVGHGNLDVTTPGVSSLPGQIRGLAAPGGA
jgi:hypothetical protein